MSTTHTARDHGDEWQPRADRPAPVAIPNRGRYDADLAPAFTALAAMYGPQDRATPHLERLIASLRRQNDALRADRAKQETELAHLRALTIHQTRTIDDQRRQLALAQQAARHALCAPEAPPLVLVALATVLCSLEALGARINRMRAHEGWGR